MLGSRFITIGPNPAFFQRLRTWFKQSWILDLGVAEILGPAPAIAKEAEAKIFTTPAPFSRSASRAPVLGGASTCAVAPTCTAAAAPAAAAGPMQTSAWMELRPIQGLRRQLRRRKGWNDLRKTQELQACEESVGLLAGA